MSSSVPSPIDSNTVGIPPGLEDLVASAPFKRLTRQQKIWILEFLSNGQNAVAAARVAYPGASKHSQICISYQVSQSPAVQDALEFWKWRSPREALIAECKKNLRKSEPGSTAATKFITQLERLMLGIPNSNKAHFVDPDDPDDDPEVDESEPAPKKFVVGDRISERGDDGVEHVGIIRSLDAFGFPLIVDEVPL